MAAKYYLTRTREIEKGGEFDRSGEAQVWQVSRGVPNPKAWETRQDGEGGNERRDCTNNG
jgi:hypothetical protein